MRIGIDYLPAVTRAQGMGRYTRELVRALVQLDAPPELALFDVGRTPRVVCEQSLGLYGAGPHVKRVHSTLPRRVLPWIAPILHRQADRWLGGVDLFQHVLVPGPPIARARQCLALAELPAEGSRADAALRDALARMDGVLVFGLDVKERLARRYGLPSARIHRTPVGCDHWRRELAAPPVRATPPVILVLGSVRTARRHVAIVRGVEALARRGVETELCCIGRAGSAADEFRRTVASSPVRDRVHWHREAKEAEMPELVGRASVLVHLADDEGSPVTPLEGFAQGLAVVASPVAAFREALGDLALWIDNAEAVREPGRLADALVRGLESAADPALRDARERHALRFTWLAAARATVDVWQRILGAR